ncbi:MAG TPA: hypothetical protein VHS80_07680 [Chthoniobacterales bacterium]|nr:hypothetical protein [Chthoniobacterales bacterium]
MCICVQRQFQNATPCYSLEWKAYSTASLKLCVPIEPVWSKGNEWLKPGAWGSITKERTCQSAEVFALP